MRCHECSERFWVGTQEESKPGRGWRQHFSWLLPLALVLSISTLYIYLLPYEKGQARQPGERSAAEEAADEASGGEEEDTGRRLSELRLTPVVDGLRLELLGAAPLEHSTLRHFQVPDRLVLDLAGPWAPPAPGTAHLQHPLLDRVRLVERGAGLRLELLLRVTDVEASLEETEEGLVISVRPPA